MRSISLADVARRAGVSVATASRALSASRPVSAENARRVAAAARELGYSGNGIARALRRQRSDTIGMIVPSVINPFFTTLIDQVERVTQAEGKLLLLCDAREDPELEALHLESLVARQVDGIVISPTHQISSRSAVERAASRVPLVQLDRETSAPGLDWVGVDDHAALALAVGHLWQRGARSAAYVSSVMDHSSAYDRLAGFHASTRKLGLETRPDWIVEGPYSVANGEQAVTTIISEDPADRPDAIVCANDLIAIGVIRACQARGLRVPEDIRVTGLDGIEFGRYTEPQLTTVAQPLEAMAAESLRLLTARAGSRDRPASRVALTPTLVVRGSA